MTVAVIALTLVCVVLLYATMDLRAKLYHVECKRKEILGAYVKLCTKDARTPPDCYTWPTKEAEYRNELLRVECNYRLELLDNLDPRTYDIIHLYLITRKRVEDIATIFDMKEEDVRICYQEGLRRLLRKMGRESEIFDWPFWRSVDVRQ